MKVKVFMKKASYFSALKNFSSAIEDELNAWLAQNTHIKVVDIRQSQGGGSFEPTRALITVWYENA